MLKTKFLTSMAIGLALGLGAVSASADEVANFYKGKRLTLLVGSGPGGGYDTYARLVSRHMGRHIPGNPTFITKRYEMAYLRCHFIV